MLQKLNGNLSEEDLAGISRIMQNQYPSNGCRLEVFTYLDDSTRRHVAAFHYTSNSMPESMPENNGSSNLSGLKGYTPIAVGSLEVTE